MGIESLRKAASAAGFAMANSEDMVTTESSHKQEGCKAWRPADPRALVERTGGAADIVTPARGIGLREWWLLLSRKATA
jgi:hypothetical protein